MDSEESPTRSPSLFSSLLLSTAIQDANILGESVEESAEPVSEVINLKNKT